ncbi:hypothetical protein [Algicola sagamiensis]|uniref:hypothetical protein n=1 Tax=Algicola sagamiensis TaxID=163869 RepID=UPI000365FF85|nr:hypothetical protein [Algicola sagamiensis]
MNSIVFTPDEILGFSSFFSFLLGGIFIILFSQISVKYMKKRVYEDEGVSVSSWEGGIGIVLINLAMAVVFEKLADHPLFPDNKYARKYARKLDYFFALMILILMGFALVGMTVMYFVYL